MPIAGQLDFRSSFPNERILYGAEWSLTLAARSGTPIPDPGLQCLDNLGNGADLNDYDRDGLGNLLEFTSGVNPRRKLRHRVEIFKFRYATGPWSPWMTMGPVAASSSNLLPRVGPLISTFS